MADFRQYQTTIRTKWFVKTSVWIARPGPRWINTEFVLQGTLQHKYFLATAVPMKGIGCAGRPLQQESIRR